MKKSFVAVACLVFLLAGVSLAKSGSKSIAVKGKSLATVCLELTKCQQARQEAAGVAFQALAICNNPDNHVPPPEGGDDRCTIAMRNANNAILLADYICSVFPDPDDPFQPPQPKKPVIGRVIKTVKHNKISKFGDQNAG